MVDELDTDEGTAQEGQEQEQEQEQTDLPETQDKDEEPQKPFSPEQEQYLGSWLGRIVKKQLEENLPVREEPVIPQAQHNEALKGFNEELQTMVFDGDVVGAVKRANEVLKRADTNLSKAQAIEADKAIVSYSDKPFYNDIYADMKKVVHEAVGNGYPPHEAVRMAYAETKSALLENKIKESGGHDGLGLLSGGSKPRTNKDTKVPAKFKAACAKDIKSGLFKDEADWISALSPEIRAANGMA